MVCSFSLCDWYARVQNIFVSGVGALGVGALGVGHWGGGSSLTTFRFFSQLILQSGEEFNHFSSGPRKTPLYK